MKESPPATLGELVARYRHDGDERAIEEVVRQTRPRLLAVAKGIASPGEAEDAVQGAYFSLLRRTELPDDLSVAAWLTTAVVRIAYRSRARARQLHAIELRLARVESGAEQTGPPERASSAEESALVRRAVDELPSRYRDVMLLHYFEGLTTEEIAALLGIPRGTVTTWLYRARQLLHDRLGVRLSVGLLLLPGVLADWLRTGAGLSGWTVTVGAAMKFQTAIVAVILTLASGVFLWQWQTADDITRPATSGSTEGNREPVAEPTRQSEPTRQAEPPATNSAADAELSTPAESGLAITGYVRDDSGVPLEGASIMTLRGAGPEHPAPPRQDKTGADGGFRVAGLEADEFTLIFKHPECSSQARVVVKSGGDEIEIVLVRGTAVAGIVLDPAGRPIADARVEVGPSMNGLKDSESFSTGNAGSVRAASSGADGRFRVAQLPHELCTARATCPGYRPSELLVVDLSKREPVSEVTLRLRAGSTLSGTTILDGGAPLAGVEVVASAVRRQEERAEPSDRFRSTSGADGAFAISGLDPNRIYRLEAILEGYALADGASDAHPGDAVNIVLTLAPTAGVRGRVVDAEGRPVEARLATAGRTAGTSADGNYELLGLPPGVLPITCTPVAPFLPAERTLVIVAEQVLDAFDFVVERGGEVTGFVLGEGDLPIAGAQISLEEPSKPWGSSLYAATRDDGSFALSSVPPAGGLLVCKARDYLMPEQIPVKPGDRHTFHLERGLALIGRVIDLGGAPVTDYLVRIEAQGGFELQQSVRATIQAADGRFRLAGLTPDAHLLSVQAEGFATTYVELPQLPDTGEFDLGDITLGEGLPLRGVVLLPDGGPAAGAKVVILRRHFRTEVALEGHAPEPLPSAVTDAEGRFELAGVPAAEVDIAAHLAGWPPARAQLDLREGAPAADIVLRLRSGSSLVGKVSRQGGAAVPGARLSLRGGTGTSELHSTTDAAGEFRFGELRPGSYTVALALPGAVAAVGGFGSQIGAQVVLADGEEERCDFSLDGFCHVTGRIRGWDAGAFPEPLLALMADDATLFCATIADDGRFDLPEVLPGHYTVAIGRTVTRTADIPEAPEAFLEFELQGGRVAGRVLGADGQPAAGLCAVFLRPPLAATIYQGMRRTTVAADASFSFEQVDAGDYALYAVHFGSGQSEEMALALGAGQRIDGLTLRIAASGQMRVRVTDSAGVLTPGADLILLDASDRRVLAVATGMRETEDGVEVSGVPPGMHRVHASVPGAGVGDSAPVEVRVGEVTDVTIELRPAGTPLSLLLRRNGEPVPRATLRLRRGAGQPLLPLDFEASTQTDSRGRARLSGLAAGQYELEITDSSRPGRLPIQPTVPLTIEPGSELVERVLELN